MRQYQRLSEEARNSRRTMADAVEVLREQAGFGENDRAEICIALLKLPSAEVVGLVQIMFEPKTASKAYVVSLPTAKQFKAYRSKRRQHERFDIAKLHDAVLKGNGNVVLSDGRSIRAVEMIAAHLPLEPTELDWCIVRNTLAIIEADRCYRPLGYGLPPHLHEMVADIQFLDCSRLAGLNLPPLKVIAYDIRARDRALKDVSDQKIADALRKFGIRIPLARPRQNRHVSGKVALG